MTQSLRPGAALVAVAALLAGCATLPADRSISCAAATPPPITLSADGRTASTRLDVLTYNIEGLGWPVRRGRASELEAIGRHLADLRAAGRAPDVVLFQEVFSPAAVAGVETAGYPSQASGPGRRTRRDLPGAGAPPGRRSWTRGELSFKLATGGLAIASRYPIVDEDGEPFSRRGCAGLDCLSNKGALLARIAVPGAPVPLDIFNSHLNSRKASGASRRRTLAAHAIQTVELSAFMAAVRDRENPTILGGDFNMRGSEARFEFFDSLLPLTLVHRYCLEARGACDVKASWDGDAPWMDTQDLQLFGDGRRMSVRPVRVETLFDGRPDSPTLSDHDGLKVTYELTWPASTTLRGVCAS